MIFDYLRRIFSRHTPRWIVFNIDLAVVALSFVFSYSIIRNLQFETFTMNELLLPLMLMLLLKALAIVVTKSYKGIVKYTSIQDATRIFLAMTISTFAFVIIRRYMQSQHDVLIVARRSIIIMDYFICLVALTSLRIGYKLIYRRINRIQHNNLQNIIIYGAGHTGMMAKRSIEADMTSRFKVIAFLDDNRQLAGKSAEGVPIYNFNKKFDYVTEKFLPKELIIAIPEIAGYKKKKVIEIGLQHNLVIKNVPPIDKWINGEFTFNQIKNVNVSDLLGREPMDLENKNIQNALKGKVVLVTGAAGSIGSEIAKQCTEYNPKYLMLLDQAETPLYELEYKINKPNIEMMIGDVANEGRMRQLFKAFKPDIIFHAAAYKHVPLMEDNPYEAVNTNVFGTRILANLAVEYNAEKFVFVSTDKAVNPTNIMGASKRIAEMYVQSLNNILDIKQDTHTKFITTRFGNVLGSNGSVIPRFKQQIEEGGPLTVTHPDITRYFMTIPEACQLVLEAGSMGNGGEIYIFDMGESVRIVDLAKKMIKLSGFQEGKDIEIVFTGLRPGEKLTEELLNQKEQTIGTHHPKIMVAKVRKSDYAEIEDVIEGMLRNRDKLTNRLIVTSMKQMIPEFISNNSIYEELDKKAQLAIE
ncbi:MAG: polysaccharide biosynthesis protein [Bacteroidetes bacterium]|nr:polysaccharide biosynthesis protein [Bacteroidota bacterium]